MANGILIIDKPAGWTSHDVVAKLRGILHERRIGRLTIKKRGVQVVPDELRKRLALKGEEEGTLVLTRVAGQGTALLVEPF